MALHKITHSQGLVVLSAQEGVLPPELSFRVGDDGEITTVAGWGYAGYVPEVPMNPPPNSRNVLTVGLEGNTDEAFGALRTLVQVHQARFGECLLWLAAGASRDLRNWVVKGCPPLTDEPVSDGAWATSDNGEEEGDGDKEEEEPAEPVEPEELPAEPTTADMRAWAKGQGIEVPDRGKLPANVIEAFQAAHSDPA